MIMGKRLNDPRCEVVVRASGSGRETRYVALVAFLTLIICCSAIVLRNTTAKAVPVPSWQVDAFNDLTTSELATFNALHSAAPEIDILHEDGLEWPSVDQLALEYMPPFVQDAAWEMSGKLAWSRTVISTKDKHIACYLGRPSNPKKSRAFLLVMLHDHGPVNGTAHAPYEVWLHESVAVDMPSMINDQALINSGWREVVARSGEKEIARTKGEEYLQ